MVFPILDLKITNLSRCFFSLWKIEKIEIELYKVFGVHLNYLAQNIMSIVQVEESKKISEIISFVRKYLKLEVRLFILTGTVTLT